MFHSFPNGKGGLLMLGRLEDKSEASAETGQSRAAPRRRLYLATAISQAEAGCDVDVFNISETGILLGTSGTLALDEPITVVLPDIGERLATIVWYSENLYGCRFAEPLDNAEVAACLAYSMPEGPRRLPPRQEEATLGERLKLLRTRSKFSMVELARQAGVTKPTLWKWETDKVRPREAALKRLAAALEVTPTELLYGKPVALDAQQAAHSPQDPGNPSQYDPTETLAKVISQSRAKIAQLAGTEESQVSIDIDWD